MKKKESPVKTQDGSVCYQPYDGEYRKWDGKQWVVCKDPGCIIERPWPFDDLNMCCIYGEEWKAFK
jgi:hypothetical protein